MKKKYLRLFTFSFLIILFSLFLCKPIIPDELEVPEIVVYGEGYIPLDKNAFVYAFADTKIMRPIIDIIPVSQLKNPQAMQVIDRTELAVAALFSGDTGRFFQLVGFGSYPNLLINIALAVNSNWRFTFQDMSTAKDNYWYSDKDRLAVNLNSEEVHIICWRRTHTRMNPVYEEPGVKMPEGFTAFRHRSGEPAPLSLWLENQNSILDIMFYDEGITVNIPIERLYLNLYHVKDDVFKIEIMLQTMNIFFSENFAMNFSSIEPVNAESGESEAYAVYDSVLRTLFLANPPVQNGRNVEFQSVFLSKEEIASLLRMFMRYWR